LLFFFARDIAGAQGALMVMLIYLCNVPLLNAAAAGTRYTLVAAAVTSFFMLLRRDRNESFLYSFVLGSVAGVCYLAAYAGLFLLVPLVMFKLRRRKYQNGRHLLMAFAGFMLVAGPWMIRLLRVGGNPLWGQSLGALFLSSPSLPVAAGGIGARLYLQLALWYATLISIYGGGVALAFFLISPLVRCGDPAHEECKLLLWSALLPVAAASLVGDGRVEIFTAFVPLMLLWGVQAFNEIIAPRPESAKRLRVFFVAVNCIPFLVVLTAAAHPGVRAELWGARIRAMADMHSMMHTGDIVMTNAPEWLAYYGEFNTLPLPRDEEELAMWEEEFGGLGFAVVCPYGLKTPLAQSMLDRKRVPEWFIAERALVYPQGERFFSVNAAGGMAAGGIK
ncbi:MAG: hypothetical protein NT045_07170, partial [Candidatus Aureabacteria bacterium]|nr:hypothetical protein [Candidatus Auribacterota bacterium]